MHSHQPTNLTIHYEIRWHKRVCDDRLNGWLQCPAGDPVCRDPPARGHHTGFFCGGSLPPCAAAGERSEFNIKSPLGAPPLTFPRGHLLKSFPQVDTSARQRGFEIRVFPLLGELPKAIEPHLPVCQLYRWQLGPNMWSSPTTKSLDPIVVTPFGWASQGKATDPPHVDLPAIFRNQRRGHRRRHGCKTIMLISA